MLYQLPPRWCVDLKRLETFVRSLPRRRRHVIEFRDPSWYTDEVFHLLSRHHVACCIHDIKGSATCRRAVDPSVYARFHGPAQYRGMSLRLLKFTGGGSVDDYAICRSS